MSVRVVCKADVIEAELAGLTVEQVFNRYYQKLEIPVYAKPTVNAKKASSDLVLKDGDKLEFILPAIRCYGCPLSKKRPRQE
jgi:hypothetical protein